MLFLSPSQNANRTLKSKNKVNSKRKSFRLEIRTLGIMPAYVPVLLPGYCVGIAPRKLVPVYVPALCLGSFLYT